MNTARLMLFLVLVLDALHCRALAAESSSGSWLPIGRGAASSPIKLVSASSSSKSGSSGDSTSGFSSIFGNRTSKKHTGTKTTLTGKSKATNSGYITYNPKEKKPGFFKSFMRPEPPTPPKSIKEWMKLKQVHP